MYGAKVKIHFKAGSRQKVYQRPISQEDFEEEAVLVECLRPSSEFDYEGVVVEEWSVRFDGETETYPRVITAMKAGSHAR